jgi:P27 family predicted phage terminase small subunit
MPAGARTEFHRLAKHLFALGLVSKVEPVLPMLALNIHRWREAEKVIEERGPVMTFITKAGDEIDQQRPEVAIAKQYQSAALKICAEYGLTPSSRTRVKTIAEDEAKGHSNFLFGEADNVTEFPK